MSIQKENCSNKSYDNRLTRFGDRLLPYHFSLEHMPGAQLGLVDYISRHPKILKCICL